MGPGCPSQSSSCASLGRQEGNGGPWQALKRRCSWKAVVRRLAASARRKALRVSSRTNSDHRWRDAEQCPAFPSSSAATRLWYRYQRNPQLGRRKSKPSCYDWMPRMNSSILSLRRLDIPWLEGSSASGCLGTQLGGEDPRGRTLSNERVIPPLFR